MKLTITINLDNSAFQPSPNPEAAYILQQLVDRIKQADFKRAPRWNRVLADSNGNSVGEARVTK